jgi:LPS export ABC transporter protein LptC
MTRTPAGITALLILCSVAAGCSLRYTEDVRSAEDTVPEFVFSDAQFSRIENSRETIAMHAARLEQYKGGSKTYGKNISFMMRDNQGRTDTEGSCGMLASDSNAEKYMLYDDITIFNHPRNVKIHADELRWNGKTEQLTSGRTDTITITKEGTTIHGSGFSASGISNTFTFTGTVSGTVDTSDTKPETAEGDTNAQK